jgi:D-arginine dehydrogenase
MFDRAAMTTECDFLIIGGGMAGVSAAAELSAFGRVIVLEREAQPGYHATGRSAALYSAIYGNAAVRALSAASRSFFDMPPPGFCDLALLTPRSVYFCGTRDGQDALDDMAEDSGGLLRPASADEMLARVPILNPDHAVTGLFEEDACDIDVAALLQSYAKRARAFGVRIALDAEATSLARSSGFWNVTTLNEEYSAAVVVNAAGAWADRTAQMAGVAPLGLLPLRRTAMLIDAPNELDVRHWPCVIDAQESFYFKPDAGRLLLSPADETPSEPCDAQPEELDVAIAIDRFEAATTMRVTRPSHRWAGLRTFSPDRTPVIGFDPVAPGFFWLAGQGGYGIQTAPAAAKLAAALAANAKAAIRDEVDERLCSPARFA